MVSVIHLSTCDIAGGAARAAYRLHRALIDDGVKSRMLVKSKSSDDPTVMALPALKIKSLTRRLIEERWSRFSRERRLKDGAPDGVWHDCRAPYRQQDFAAIAGADIVHLHWTSGMLDWPKVLPWLALEKPLVWTLHDMNPFLGALHYQDGGISLPKAFASWDKTVLLQKSSILHAFPQDRLRIIAPSRWMKMEAEQSQTLSRFSVDHVPYGVCGSVFRPLAERESLRLALGIPPDRVVLGFVAQNLAERRKGFNVFLRALECLGDYRDHLLILSAGANGPRVEGIEIIHLGSFDNERIMNVFYNAIDFFVCPSLADNLPNTVLEAMSCGVPTVAFDVGGLQDMVLEEKTGWLVPASGGAEGLAKCILQATENRSITSQSVRSIAAERFSLQQQAAKVKSIYYEVVAKPK